MSVDQLPNTATIRQALTTLRSTLALCDAALVDTLQAIAVFDAQQQALPPALSPFRFSDTSENELRTVHLALQDVVRTALSLSTQDFAVHDGKRSVEEQQALVAKGASQTLHSKHLTGHAVDLVPVIGGKLRWDWPAIFPIASAMRQAAGVHGLTLTWGGCWDIPLTLAPDDHDPQTLMEGYAARRRAAGKTAFLDGAHFELVV
jgi:peptidoglycan L-alanyl-D-glutamate endopeptidase CwlK